MTTLKTKNSNGILKKLLKYRNPVFVGFRTNIGFLNFNKVLCWEPFIVIINRAISLSDMCKDEGAQCRAHPWLLLMDVETEEWQNGNKNCCRNPVGR